METKGDKIMTKDDLQANHPSVYNAILKEGSQAGIAQRNDVIGAWLAYNDVNAKAVSEGIASGESLSQTAMAGFNREMFSAETLKKEEAGSQEDLKPEATTVGKPENESGISPEAQAELDSFLTPKSK